MASKIVKVIVDSPLVDPLDYLRGDCENLQIGQRCLVPFGRRTVVGLVVGEAEKTDYPEGKLRKVIAQIDDVAPVRDSWLKLTNFAAKYYLFAWGQVAIPALPKFFRKAPGRNHNASLANVRKEKALVKRKTIDVPPKLNAEQEKVLEEFKPDKFKVGLLYGITGSGKTEVYLRLVDDVLRKDKDAQALLMVPEINLTPQLVERIRARFPDKNVVAWNSAIAEGQKAKAWLAVHEGRAQILVGTRLSVFASFKKLALIVVDEEHDYSFKSIEGVRYSARDLAIKKAQLENIPILLGSATPSLESFAKGLQGKYQLLHLTKRALEQAHLPSLEVIDTTKSKATNGLTQEVRDAITETLNRKEQILVFLNRRGYAPVVTCNGCGWEATCPHCSTFAVFHKTTGRLTCHYCGWSMPIPKSCPKCGSVELMPTGRGTQRVEEEIQRLWPNAVMARMDQDSTRKKGSAEEMISQVHAGQTDILLGTQIIAKGHDFKRVSLVVILNSDYQLMSGDFRARERLFSVLLQVSGRSGRADIPGRVLLQTKYASDPLFKFLAKQDFTGFAKYELASRKITQLPPFSTQALLVAEGKKVEDVVENLKKIKEIAKRTAKKTIRIYDPVPQAITRIFDVERAQLLFEAETKKDLLSFLVVFDQLLKEKKFKFRWYFDVDPLSC